MHVINSLSLFNFTVTVNRFAVIVRIYLHYLIVTSTGTEMNTVRRYVRLIGSGFSIFNGLGMDLKVEVNIPGHCRTFHLTVHSNVVVNRKALEAQLIAGLNIIFTDMTAGIRKLSSSSLKGLSKQEGLSGGNRSN
ncbi:hypothetical protein IEQ34_005570 [Dendrobium chrysotoxum]|uniref:Uncharacterized protein n=1 Tax=Dendrobium chrysotoxum TaxID=161865 RepID=A0AAV7HC71_DENCH|nr:hypothetical protein IEQ34_005570 [Dendrobium chrysotoxum]